MNKVGVATIGVGGWGKNHARVYDNLTELCSLKAVCDKNVERAKYYGDLYKVDWTDNLTKLLERTDIDAVSICTPSETHYEVALQALNAGKNLFIEKPLTLQLKHAFELYRTANLRKVNLMVGFIERFNTGVRKVKELINKNDLGFVSRFCATRISTKRLGTYYGDIVRDTAIHDIDVIRFISEEDPVRVYAEQQQNIQSKNSESIEMFLYFKSGKTAHIDAEWLHPADENMRKIRQLHVTGSNGTIILSYIPQLVWKIDAVDILSPFIDNLGRPKYSRDPRGASLIQPLVWEEPLRLELESFLKSIIYNEPCPVSGIEGIRALEIAEAALTSSGEGRPKNINYEVL